MTIFSVKKKKKASDEEMLPFLDSSITGFQLCSPKIVGLLVINTITSVISNHLAQFVGAMFYDGSLPFYNRKLWNCLFFLLYSSQFMPIHLSEKKPQTPYLFSNMKIENWWSFFYGKTCKLFHFIKDSISCK